MKVDAKILQKAILCCGYNSAKMLTGTGYNCCLVSKYILRENSEFYYSEGISFTDSELHFPHSNSKYFKKIQTYEAPSTIKFSEGKIAAGLEAFSSNPRLN